MMINYYDNDMVLKIVQIFVLVAGGIFILRFAGRKSISQMTFPTLVITISYGTLLMKPLSLNDDLFMTLILIAVMVFFLFLIEVLEVKVNWIEQLVTGSAITIVENGNLNIKNMKKSRITIDQLEGMLREKSIKHYSDCEWVTLETNGKIGYLLKRENRPLTIGEFEKKFNAQTNQPEIFSEVSNNKHANDINPELF